MILKNQREKKIYQILFLKIIKKNYNKKCKYINEQFQNIESLDKPINNFNIEEIKKDLEKYQTELIKIENNINQDLEKNIFIELKSFNFLFDKEYDSIVNGKAINISINNPIKINFSLQIIKKELLSIIFPISIYILEEKEKNKTERKINLIPLLKINNIMYTDFKKEKKTSIFFDDVQDIKKNEINIIEDDEDDKEIKNIINDIKFNEKNLNKNEYVNNFEEENKNKIIEIDEEENDIYKYVLSVKLNELNKGINKFQLFIYYYYFYNQ